MGPRERQVKQTEPLIDVASQHFRTNSGDETCRVGEQLAATLKPSSVVLLFGDLGAGKTTFVRGLAAGLGIEPSEVSSPTFVLIQEYRGPVTLHHVDLYRIEGVAVEDLGVEELASERAVVVIEWAERLPWPIPGAIHVKLEDKGQNVREITIEGSRLTTVD